MLHAREDYNRIQDPSGIIPEDEPVFLLRGQDPIAPALVIKWAQELSRMGGDKGMSDIAIEQAKKMIEWQKVNGYKIPDLPNTNEEIAPIEKSYCYPTLECDTSYPCYGAAKCLLYKART